MCVHAGVCVCMCVCLVDCTFYGVVRGVSEEIIFEEVLSEQRCSAQR